MVAFQIKEVKSFMAAFLTGELFHSFLLEEAVLVTCNTFQIDGKVVPDFYEEEDRESGLLSNYEYIPWKDLQPVCFQMIKGKRTPVSFRFVLQLKKEEMEGFLQKGDTALTSREVKAFILNVKYEKGKLTLVTAVSYHAFLMDKTPDEIWDKGMRSFLTEKGIAFEEQ